MENKRKENIRISFRLKSGDEDIVHYFDRFPSRTKSNMMKAALREEIQRLSATDSIMQFPAPIGYYVRTYTIRLYKGKDDDLIEFINMQNQRATNWKSGFIRLALREYMKNNDA